MLNKPFELTLDVARKRILQFNAMADEYNKWVKEARDNLLINIGPRLAQVGHKMYMGCGFHYGLEQDFGGLIVRMALPWQPSLNHYKKLLNDEAKAMTTKIIYNQLIERLEEAEKSAEKYEQQ